MQTMSANETYTEIYKASLPVRCVALKPEAKSAQSRKKTSCNGNLVLVSVRKKKERKKERNSLCRLKELCINQRPSFCYWSLSCIVLQSDDTIFFIRSNRSLPFETKLHVLLSLRELLEGSKIF